MSDRDADDFDLISVEIIREESAVITLKVPKGHSGPPPDIFQDSELRCEVLDYLEPQRWFCNSLRTGVCWTPNRKHEHVFDARPLIEKEGAPPPKYDPDELKEFIEEATKAWADVPDAAAWVRELRGGKP